MLHYLTKQFNAWSQHNGPKNAWCPTSFQTFIESNEDDDSGASLDEFMEAGVDKLTSKKRKRED
jgi:hypothetical protein